MTTAVEHLGRFIELRESAILTGHRLTDSSVSTTGHGRTPPKSASVERLAEMVERGKTAVGVVPSSIGAVVVSVVGDTEVSPAAAYVEKGDGRTWHWLRYIDSNFTYRNAKGRQSKVKERPHQFGAAHYNQPVRIYDLAAFVEALDWDAAADWGEQSLTAWLGWDEGDKGGGKDDSESKLNPLGDEMDIADALSQRLEGQLYRYELDWRRWKGSSIEPIGYIETSEVLCREAKALAAENELSRQHADEMATSRFAKAMMHLCAVERFEPDLRVPEHLMPCPVDDSTAVALSWDFDLGDFRETERRTATYVMGVLPSERRSKELYYWNKFCDGINVQDSMLA